MLPSLSEEMCADGQKRPREELTATPLTNQVAGHMFDKNSRKMGMLSLGPQLVLKALQDGPRGARELDFYRTVTSTGCTNSDSIGVRKFLAAFHGTVEIDEVKFMKLENITQNFKHPCISDLKMGKIYYDPFAAPEKVASQKKKCPSAAILGFQISGMVVYQPHNGQVETMDKFTGHKMTIENMLKDGIGKFFGYPHFLRKDIIRISISKLHDIEDWFKTQKQYKFYASSLLIVYEGFLKCLGSSQCRSRLSSNCALHPDGTNLENGHPPNQTSSSASCDICPSEPSRVDIRMIDFTHVYPSTDIDHNYLAGLKNLIAHLDRLLELEVSPISDSSLHENLNM